MNVTEIFAAWLKLWNKRNITDLDFLTTCALERAMENTPATDLAEMKLKMKLAIIMEDSGGGGDGQVLDLMKSLMADADQLFATPVPVQPVRGEPVALAA